MIRSVNQASSINVLKIPSECLLNTILCCTVKQTKKKVLFLLYVILLKDLAPLFHYSLPILVGIDAVHSGYLCIEETPSPYSFFVSELKNMC